MNVCVSCFKEYELVYPAFLSTCSQSCHDAYVQSVVDEFGETKRITHLVTGKTHLVPTRVIAKFGVSARDLHLYPVEGEDAS